MIQLESFECDHTDFDGGWVRPTLTFLVKGPCMFGFAGGHLCL